MTQRKYRLHNGEKGSALAIRLEFNAPVDEIAAILEDGTLQIRLSSPPAEMEANRALAGLLSEVLGVPKSKIEIVAGLSGKEKLVSIMDTEAGFVHKKITDYLSQ